MMSNPEKKAFKNWFDEGAAARLAAQFSGACSKFDGPRFRHLATRDLESLEFQGRVRQFASALAQVLPADVRKALSILVDSLPAPQADCEAVTDGWLQWPLGQYIAEYAVEHPDEAMPAMIELTKRFSSEFAVRPFVERYPEKVFPLLLELTADPNPHVRRWCSEGVRTRLPWGRKLHALIADPSPVWPILDRLNDDPEPYVRKSVANNLNDLAKDHPEQVIERCRDWLRHPAPAREWIVKHALRSLIKDGHPDALGVVGFSAPDKIDVDFSLSPRRIAIGESICLSATLRSRSRTTQPVTVDYAVHYVRKADRSSAKVFKWKTVSLPAGGSVFIEKIHPMKPTTIRALYPGAHRVEIQVNGVRLAEAPFHLR